MGLHPGQKKTPRCRAKKPKLVQSLITVRSCFLGFSDWKFGCLYRHGVIAAGSWWKCTSEQMDGDSSAKHEVLNFQAGFCRFWLNDESDIYGECWVRRKGGQAFYPYDDQCFPIFCEIVWALKVGKNVTWWLEEKTSWGIGEFLVDRWSIDTVNSFLNGVALLFCEYLNHIGCHQLL